MSDTAHVPGKNTHESNRWQIDTLQLDSFLETLNEWRPPNTQSAKVTLHLCLTGAVFFKNFVDVPCGTMRARQPHKLSIGRHKLALFHEAQEKKWKWKGVRRKGQDSIKDEQTASEHSSHLTLFKYLGCSLPLPQRLCMF